MKHDLSVSGGGSLYLLTPSSRRGLAWVKEKVEVPDWVGPAALGMGVPVEHRYITDILAGATRDGLRVRSTTGDVRRVSAR